MRLNSICLVVGLGVLAGCACETAALVDAGRDASIPDAPQEDVWVALDARASLDVGADAPMPADAASCLTEGHLAGERFPAGDGCNFCDCNSDGTRICTDRECGAPFTTCVHDGVMHDYGVRFALGDGCNDCLCAPSGLACTRRTCTGAREEGAILLESMNEQCGDNVAFTAARVLADLPRLDFVAPFQYDRMRALSPETLPDTTIHVRIVAGDFAVCRLQMPGQAAIDMDALLEVQTADGAFNEGGRAYLRKNDFGFVDAWFSLLPIRLAAIHGTYRPSCRFTPRDLMFSVQVDRTGAVSGAIDKTCEADISLTVGAFQLPPL